MAFEVILFCFIWLASESPPPDERGVALYFGQTAAEDHLAGDPTHLLEIYGESPETVNRFSSSDSLLSRRDPETKKRLTP